MSRWRQGAVIVAGLSLAGCAVPPYASYGGRVASMCHVINASGFMLDRDCNPFEQHWLPGAHRIQVTYVTPADIAFLEISGRHRSITVRKVRPGLYCAADESYPERYVSTRRCVETEASHPPISVRG